MSVIPALLFVVQATAQQPVAVSSGDKKIDSLLQVLKGSKEDANKVNTLDGLYQSYGKNNNQTEAEEYNDEAWLLSKKIGYIKGEARSMVNKAVLCKKEKQWEKMLQYSLPAAVLLKNTDDTLQKARCASITGDSYYFQTIYPDAIKYYTESVWYWKELKNYKVVIQVNLILAECLRNLGNYTLAFQRASEALELSIKTGDKPREEISDMSVSASYYYSGKYKEARDYLERALSINKTTGDEFQYAQIQNSIADLLMKENLYAESLPYISRALKIYERPDAPSFGKQWCHNLFSSVSEGQGDSAFAKQSERMAHRYYQDALHHQTTALKLCVAINDKVLISEKYLNLGRICRKISDYRLARIHLLKAVPLARELRLKDIAARSYQELSLLDSIAGNFKGAFENGKQYKNYSDSLAMEAEKGRIDAFTAEADIKKKEQELQLLSSENKLKTTVAEKENQKRKFAYAAIGVVLLLSAFGFYRYRRFSRMKAEQKLLKDRLQISQDLHDNIGSTLSSISVYSQVARIQGEKKEEGMNELLEKISSTSNEMVTEMNDIVWAINPRNDSMEKIIQRMESFAKPLAAVRNIQFDLHYSPSILTLQMNMEKRKNFYLIFKEAVNNAIKYSGAAKLNVDITQQNSQLELLVKDNGVGFNVEKEMKEPSRSLSGNGLKNMYARAKEMNAALSIKSFPNDGASVQLIFPLS